MRERPILFNTEMVQALLAGRKTCTRRLVKFLPGKNPQWTGYIKDGLMLYNGKNEPCIRKAPYQPEDILYVRETWFKDVDRYMYRANYSDREKFYRDSKEIEMKWKPSIHMPKEAARIWLKVTDVRVERLQDITEDGAKEEGANCKNGKNIGLEEKMRRTAIERFAEIWNSTIKKTDLDRYGWDANPWVWVIEFERCKSRERSSNGEINKPRVVRK